MAGKAGAETGAQRMSGQVTASTWWLDLDDLPVPAAALDRLLDARERARAKGLREAADRLRLAAGRALCRAVLARLTGTPAPTLAITCDGLGRPGLDGGGGPWFNLTHSGAVVALAVAPFPEIGIDTEAERPGIAEELAATVCSEAERAALAALAPTARRRHFFELWTLKEAHMKATGQGLGLDPRRCAFDLAALPRAVSLPGGDSGAWRFAMWRLPPGQALSVCARPPAGRALAFDAPRRADAVLAAALAG